LGGQTVAIQDKTEIRSPKSEISPNTESLNSPGCDSHSNSGFGFLSALGFRILPRGSQAMAISLADTARCLFHSPNHGVEMSIQVESFMAANSTFTS